jgi:CBS domain-containing protein
MNLAEIMTTNFAVVTPQATLADASRRMVDVDIGAAVVVENDRLVGMVSECDLLRVFRDGGSPDQLVEDRMTRDVRSASLAIRSGGIPSCMRLIQRSYWRRSV